MKRIFYITTFIIVLLVSFLGITYSYEYNDSGTLNFTLIGPSTLYVDVFSEYEEYGIKVTNKNIDITKDVVIDSSEIDMSKLGEYQVKYQVLIDGNYEYIYRKVIVIDTEKPIITLKGEEEISHLQNTKYVEEGYSATDNYDKDITDKVKITSNLDVNKEGTYEIKYSVTDSNGNNTTKIRKITVKKINPILDNQSANKITSTNKEYKNNSNSIITNKFTNTGIYYEGYIKEKNNIYKIKLKNTKNSLEYSYNMTTYKDNHYKGVLDLTTVSNGEYNVYIISNKEERLINKLDILSRLIRAKIGNKLVTFEYEDDLVKIKIEDFEYKYDILIDPGHGGNEKGASNGVINEKTMNLKQSLYEKCRYESMGFKVYMTRTEDTSGELLGSKDLIELQRRALTIGYYGSISKVIYSNHHNASANINTNGFEIIVPNSTTVDDLILESSLHNKFKNYYKINDDYPRIYSRDYDTDKIFNKINGNSNENIDYYAIIRIPKQLFNIKTVIYEPIYISNINDYSWYWNNKKWIEVTEIKIEEYVNYLGGTYKKDNSKCL